MQNSIFDIPEIFADFRKYLQNSIVDMLAIFAEFRKYLQNSTNLCRIQFSTFRKSLQNSIFDVPEIFAEFNFLHSSFFFFFCKVVYRICNKGLSGFSAFYTASLSAAMKKSTAGKHVDQVMFCSTLAPSIQTQQKLDFKWSTICFF